MTTNQTYIAAGLVLLLIISKAKKGAGCGCAGTASGGATTPDKPAEWWTYAGQWSI
jgi:hypothetical protein